MTGTEIETIARSLACIGTVFVFVSLHFVISFVPQIESIAKSLEKLSETIEKLEKKEQVMK